MQKRERAVLTIRMNGETDSVVVGGVGEAVEFDRSKMSKNEKYLMRRVIVDTLFPRKAD